MNHRQRSFGRRAVAALFFLLFLVSANAQVQTARYTAINGNSNAFYEYLPQGYNPAGSQTYPLLVFIHGLGELGSGSSWELTRVLQNGPPKLINNGAFPVSFTVNGATYKFIVISPQFINWPSPGDVNNVIDYAIQNYKVDPSRVYVTGLSMGGGATWEFAGNNSGYANKAAAIVPVCGASWPEYGRARTIANANLPVWALHNSGDGTVPVSYTNDYVSTINQAPTPNPQAKKTIFQRNDHDAWSQAYDPNYRESNLNVYEWMLQYQRGTTPTPVPTVSTYTALPGKVEAEAFAGMSGIQVEGTSDVGGGGNVGYIDNGDWMDYNVNPTTAGSYTVQIRIAAAYSGGQLQLRKSDGTVLATVNVPATGGYQTWQTISTTITLASGNQTLRVISTASPNWNLNWLNFALASSIPVVTTPAPITAAALPGKIEAENWTNMSGVQTEGTTDVGGGLNVGYIDNGDWMEYSVNPATTGTYTFNFRVASAGGGSFQLKKSDGTVLATVNVPNTGGWQAWQTVSASVSLAAGTQTLRLQSTGGGWNINWFEAVSGSTTITTPTTPTTAAATSARIEAENYTAMSGVQKEGTSDVGGGENVGYIDNGDWMDYSINPSAAGAYAVSFRIASPSSGAQFQLRKSDGTVLATVNVPNTGGWQTWQTVTANVTLAAGTQTLRIVSTAAANWNINWWEYAPGAATGTTTTTTTTTTPSTGGVTLPGKVEAENWTNMSGVQTENTSDAGGGLNVGWIDYNDWMEYSVNAPSAGSYTLQLRIATPNSNAQLQIRKADGTVLTTVSLPNTGGYQTWQTVSTTLNLVQGAQTIRLVSTGGGSFNINWLQFASASAGLMANKTTESVATSDALSTAQAEVYPNPVVNQFVLKVSNNLQGTLNVAIVDLSGAVKKSFSLQKTTAAAQQFYLSIGELPQGQYMLKATMQDWTETVNIQKQ